MEGFLKHGFEKRCGWHPYVAPEVAASYGLGFAAVLVVLGLLAVYFEACIRIECVRKFDDWIADVLTLRIFRKF